MSVAVVVVKKIETAGLFYLQAVPKYPITQRTRLLPHPKLSLLSLLSFTFLCFLSSFPSLQNDYPSPFSSFCLFISP
jgi:hypothetical protein